MKNLGEYSCDWYFFIGSFFIFINLIISSIILGFIFAALRPKSLKTFLFLYKYLWCCADNVLLFLNLFSYTFTCIFSLTVLCENQIQIIFTTYLYSDEVDQLIASIGHVTSSVRATSNHAYAIQTLLEVHEKKQKSKPLAVPLVPDMIAPPVGNSQRIHKNRRIG